MSEDDGDRVDEGDRRRCPYCREEIHPEAIKCKHCGEWLAGSSKPRFGNGQPIAHLVLLMIATLGIYEVYWFYRTWRQFKERRGWDVSPGWRTVGLGVPILGLFLAYDLFKRIHEEAREAGVEPVFGVGAVFFGWVLSNVLAALPAPAMFLYLVGIWPLSAVQRTLNAYWQVDQPGLAVRTRFTGGEVALLVVGGIVWTLVLLGVFLPGTEPAMEML